jgi:hypothetical protein
MIEKCMYCGLEYQIRDSPYRDKSPQCFECSFRNELERMKLFLRDHDQTMYTIEAYDERVTDDIIERSKKIADRYFGEDK